MELSSGRILITGGGRLVGSHLAESLLNRDADVVIVDGFSKINRGRIHKEVPLINADFTNTEAVDEIGEKVRYYTDTFPNLPFLVDIYFGRIAQNGMLSRLLCTRLLGSFEFSKRDIYKLQGAIPV